jgi:flagellar biosynthesis protein FliQ
VNVAQVLTSLQDQTLSHRPAPGGDGFGHPASFFPWMLRKLMFFTIGLWSDFGPFVR